jgi:hypothetical protein
VVGAPVPERMRRQEVAQRLRELWPRGVASPVAPERQAAAAQRVAKRSQPVGFDMDWPAGPAARTRVAAEEEGVEGETRDR